MPGREETLELVGMGFVEIRGGKIRVAYNYWNFLGLLEEMSLMPKGSFEAAMSGGLAPHPLRTALPTSPSRANNW